MYPIYRISKVNSEEPPEGFTEPSVITVAEEDNSLQDYWIEVVGEISVDPNQGIGIKHK